MQVPVMEHSTLDIRSFAVSCRPAKQITESDKALFTGEYIGTSTSCLQGLRVKEQKLVDSGWHGGLLVRALNSGSRGLGQALARGTITALTVPHYTQVNKWVTAIYCCDKLWKTG